MSFARETNALDTSVIWMLPAFILSCAAAYRLAKFNLDTDQSTNFKGLPTPAAGILVASLPLILHYSPSTFGIGLLLINKWVLYGLVLLLSFLMLSSIPIMGLKFKSFRIADNLPKVILLITAIILAIFFQWLAVPMIFILYLLLSILYKNQLQ